MTLEVSLRHRQGSFILDAAFRAEAGITMLFGRSGAGKTTVVNAIAGLLRPEQGRIAVDGVALLDTGAGIFVPMHRRRVGYVFQDGRLFPHLTVRQNLLFGRAFAPRTGGVEATLDSVVDMLGIAPLMGRRPARLSGGEKQRVAIGRALLARPRLLLMDEPLAALDEARKQEIMPVLERLRGAALVPIVYVSHSISEVARLATTLVVLDQGRVIAAGPAAEIMGGQPGLSPLLGGPDAGTLLEATVAGHDSNYALTRLDSPAGTLLVPLLDQQAGTRMRAMVRARDVMLSRTRPEGISALNILPAQVEILVPAGPAAMEVRLRCDAGGTLLARVTRRSAEELALVPGMPVFAVVKSVALEGGPPPAHAADP